jgi:PAS domain S-box-containing protein
MTISRLEDGLILDANDAFCELLGYGHDEVIGRSAVDLGIYRDPAERAQMVRRVLHKGAITSHRVAIRSKDGNRMSVSISAGVITDGEDVQLFAIGRDVTSLETRETDYLREIERLQRSIEDCCGEMGTDNEVLDLTDSGRAS